MAESTTTNFCPECHYQLIPDSVFCGDCGSKLPPNPQTNIATDDQFTPTFTDWTGAKALYKFSSI